MPDPLEQRWARLLARWERQRPPSVSDNLLHLARAVAGAEDTTLTHEAVQEQLPEYLEAEMAGEPVGKLFPDIKRHLDLCPTCAEEYAALLDLALMERADQLPMPPHIPAPDLSFLPPLTSAPQAAPAPSLPDYVRDLARKVVASVAPQLERELRGMERAFFRAVQSAQGELRLGSLAAAGGLGFSGGDAPPSLRYLAATYEVTRWLTTTLSPQDIEAQLAAGALDETLRQQAEAIARRLGMDGRAARSFADQYVTLVRGDKETLKGIAARR